MILHQTTFRQITAGLLFALWTSLALATDEEDVVAVADEALARITAEDNVGLAELMIEEAMVYIGLVEDGNYSIRTRTYVDTRDRPFEVELVERGWDPTVLVSGTIAVVWYPYDIYVDGQWACDAERADRQVWATTQVWAADPWYA
ncbi:MAG: hypothetical protein P8M18_12160, partial [Woeseiaceae bacterium]|nr:hypothetical protein [Woeseiaceae bacterium]